MHRRHRPILAPLLCLALSAAAQTPTDATASPAMKLPPDQAAYKAANANHDPQQHAAALQTFLHDFPDSQRAQAARKTLLGLLLQTHADPRRVHRAAQDLVEHGGTDIGDAENDAAYQLAMAPGGGVDLKSAEHWSRDAVKRLTLASVSAPIRASVASLRLPPPSEADLHEYWAIERSSNLQTLAEVQVHRGELDQASKTLAETIALHPTLGYAYATRAELDRARHNDADALQDLETADMYGGISANDHTLMASLYAARHGGSTAGLEAEIDRRYTAAFPDFTPITHTVPSPAARTVLVELFTGSGCDPCAAADLAVEGLLKTYPAADVVPLVLDLHIPLPDPLSNPSSIARADFDSIRGTPLLRVDGSPVIVQGGSRTHANAVYSAIAAAIDTDLAQPSGVALHLTLRNPDPQAISATADVRLTDPAAARRLLASPMKSDDINKRIGDRKGDPVVATDTSKPSRLVVNFALLERRITYSGENGIRFHQNVVRSIARPSADAFPVSLTGDSSAAFTFDLPAITAGLDTYLADFSKHSDRFGTTTFRKTDTALPPSDLAVAAWVEDPVTHHVLAAAIVPVDPSAATTQQASR